MKPVQDFKKNSVDLTVIVPMYNEEENISNTTQRLIEALGPSKYNWEILLVDDGSTDRTLNLSQELSRANTRVRVAFYNNNAGRGRALRVGFNNARGSFIVTTDADLSYEPKYILDLVKELEEDKDIHIAIGSPYVKGGVAINVPRGRLLISKLGNKILGMALPGRIKTITGIFRAYRRHILESLELESDGKEIHLEILSKALAVGYKVKEIPVVLKSRLNGKSKFKFKKTAVSHLLFTFYEKPMMLFGFFGLLLFLFGFAIGIYIIVLWLKGTLNAARPLMTFVVILILAGIQMLSFGFLAIQVGILKKEIYKIQRTGKELSKRLNE